MLDRDQKEDVYKSTIININALEALKAGGVDVRFDAEDKLLHSKFLVLDSNIAVIGSHNWSAGSYFNYDDVTMVMNSESFTQELRQRSSSCGLLLSKNKEVLTRDFFYLSK